MATEVVDLVDFVASKNLDRLNDAFKELMQIQTDQKMREISFQIGGSFGGMPLVAAGAE